MNRTQKISLVVALLGSSLAFAANAEVDKKTERMWKAKCASCHGAGGKGDTDQGAKMGIADYSTPAWQKSRTDANIKTAITSGVHTEKAGKKQEMDGYPDLSPEQVTALVAMVRGFGK